MIAAEDPPKPILKLMAWTRDHYLSIRYRYAYNGNEEAEHAFEELRATAACAVPDLIRIYQEARTPSSR